MPKPAHSFLLAKAPPGSKLIRAVSEEAIVSPTLFGSPGWEAGGPLITLALHAQGRTENCSEWGIWVFKNAKSAWIRHNINARGWRIWLDVYDADEAFAYRMRWT